MAKKSVAVIMGSDSDFDAVKEGLKLLDKFDVGYEVKILSAHRSPKPLRKYVKALAKKGFKVIIAAAGGAAHLPGVIASMTILPVIGVPMMTKAFNGIDSLLSIMQMPSGLPVATMAVGSAGAKNAAILSAEIVALTDKKVRAKLHNFKKQQSAEVVKKNKLIKRCN